MSRIHKTTQQQGLHHHVHQITPTIHNHTSIETTFHSELLLLDQLFDHQQMIHYLFNKNTFCLNDSNLWTIEWLQQYLDILTEFGQLLLKCNKNSTTIHIHIDDILPITRLWHSYLETSLISYPIESRMLDHDQNIKQKINFTWDMYIVLHKPNQCQLRSYLLNNQSIINHIPNYYYLTIPSLINIEKMESTMESYKKQEINDPYESIRMTDHFLLNNQLLDQWDLISPMKICQLLFSIVLPECLNTIIMNDFGQNSLKVIRWKCLFENDINKAIEEGYYPIEVVFDLNSIGLNSFYYNSKLWKTQYTNHLTHKIQINKNNHLLSISNIDSNHNINKSESSYHSSVTMPNILIMYINFYPVFSFNDFINTTPTPPTTTTNNNNNQSKTQIATITNNRYISIYWKHNFLKLITPLQFNNNNNQLNYNLPLWSICNCLKEDFILQKIHFIHNNHYFYMKSIRILLNLIQFNDLLYNTNLLQIFNIKNMIELYLQLIDEQSNQLIIKNQYYPNVINNRKKSIIDWQQQKSLYELMNDLLKKMIDILRNKQLLSITSPETNLLQIDNDDVTNKLINQSCIILTTWYSNPLELKKLIIKKIEMLKKLIHKFNDLYPDKQIS
ncbi:unnamed protein product [Schistosoma haematobium]|nr:unnamed protein product [Schistosoma haematobium]